MKKILIFSLDYLPGTISGAEAAIQEITGRIDPREIEFHMVTLYYDSTVPRVGKIGNVLIHRVGIFGKRNASLEERRKFPLHYNKHYFQIIAGVKAFFLHRKYHYDGAWAMMAHGTAVPVSIFNILTRVPYALTLQEGDPPEYIERTMKPLWPFFKRGFMNATVVQAISEFLASWARKMGHAKPIEIIRNGANPESIEPTFKQDSVEKLKHELGKRDGEIYLVNTARLVDQKGFDTTIRALLLLPEHIKLLVVGGGPAEGSLKKLTHELDLGGRVVFTGQVERSVVTQYRMVSDIFVGPSRSEGLGNAFLSAMACRLPVIATQVGGIADFLFDAKRNPDKETTGWAVDPDEPEQIARAVEDIISHPEIVSHVTETARKMVEQEYNWDIVSKKMRERIFDKLV
ncbi:MAG: glycosyltransferase family 4 protein [Candidatus Pacebacteria bacterium]|nr:glycosyltransferase family 4 protein [Candidatus Paceibacterota bacterium]MCF7856926.1 glycosyltransferase family 4 protein [Candidatus Paceibacterota bacterium]